MKIFYINNFYLVIFVSFRIYDLIPGVAAFASLVVVMIVAMLLCAPAGHLSATSSDAGGSAGRPDSDGAVTLEGLVRPARIEVRYH